MFGALAQLGAHHTGSVGVRGSSPLCSTITNHVKQPFASIYRRLFYFGNLRFVRCLCAIAEKQYKKSGRSQKMMLSAFGVFRGR